MVRLLIPCLKSIVSQSNYILIKIKKFIRKWSTSISATYPHGLTFLQNKLKSETICSGCKFPCYEKTYVCRECSFFLHEQCFHATRSIDHPSHPTHPLNLVPYPTYQSGSFICNSCNQPGLGFSFSCLKCDYDLHLHCSKFNIESSTSSSPFLSQTTQLKQINHKSHPQHVLHLLSSPSYSGGSFYCDACSEAGNCNICHYDLHEKCAALPETMMREDHEHQLTLHYSVNDLALPTGSVITCDVCFRDIHKNLWIYYCKECYFGTHVNCVMEKAKSEAELALEQNLATQLELMKVQNSVNSTLIANSFNSGQWRYRY